MGVFRQKWDVNWILSHQNWRLNRQKWGYTVGLTNVNVENAWFSGRKMTSRLVCRRASRYLNEICKAYCTGDFSIFSASNMFQYWWFYHWYIGDIWGLVAVPRIIPKHWDSVAKYGGSRSSSDRTWDLNWQKRQTCWTQKMEFI